MSNPVDGVGGAPLFGGLSGYRRDAPSRPTSVPGSLPAFRGKTNTPGQSVGAPSVRASSNRQWKGSNALIPYARVVPLHHLQHVGRVAPGDVVFCSTYRVNRAWTEERSVSAHLPLPANANPGARDAVSLAGARDAVNLNAPLPLSGDRVATETRLVGIDWLNQHLGGRAEYDSERYAGNWAVGENVIVGTPVPQAASPFLPLSTGPRIQAHPIADNVADEWRSLPILREWACDGIVLSNDEPDCHTSNGTRDGQLFNIGIQGVCHVNNGYCTRAAHSKNTHTHSRSWRNSTRTLHAGR